MNKSPDEFQRISQYFAPLTKNCAGAFGLTDDGGVWTPQTGFEQVVTTDCLIEGVHFFSSDPAFELAQKALSVNISDLAAMGATPVIYSLVIAYPSWVNSQWISDFAGGLAVAQKQYNINLIGGDSVATPGPLTVTISAIGEVPTAQSIQRNGAQSNDDVYVSGTLGDAAIALRLPPGSLSGLTTNDMDALQRRYRCPVARVELGQSLRGLATSAIDVSDGLMADLGHLARASKVAIDISHKKVPLSEAFQNALKLNKNLIDLALMGGDDYEIAFTAPKKHARHIKNLSQDLSLKLTKIGKCSAAARDQYTVQALTPNNTHYLINNTGYTHF